MRLRLLITATLLSSVLLAQNPESNIYIKEGFIFGTAIGGSYVSLKTTDLANHEEMSLSLPNFKIGYMLNPSLALSLYLPGSLYQFTDSGRERDRGFEGITVAAQYWISDRWWVLGGGGMCLDAPAFYDIKDSTERNFYFGPAIVLGTGYELWKKGKFSLDLQNRVQYGYTNVPSGVKKGFAYSILIGFNWY